MKPHKIALALKAAQLTLLAPLVSMALIPSLALAQTKATKSKTPAPTESVNYQGDIDALKKEINSLRSAIAEQKAAAQLKPAPAKAPDNSAALTELTQSLNQVRVKVEALEDDKEAKGLSGLKISGFIDPTYIYNSQRKQGGFVFLNPNYAGSDKVDTTQHLYGDAFTYDNSYFGGVTLKFQKDFEGGLKTMFSIRPRRSAASSYDSTYTFSNIFEEAMVWVPLDGNTWKLAAGQAITYNGYEYVQSNQKKNITSNLLVDFAGPGFMTGAGVEYQEGKWWIRTMLGNANVVSDNVASPDENGNPIGNKSDKNRALHWRIDYSKGEYSGWGASGLHGKIYGKKYNYAELDAYFVRSDWTLMGQIEASKHEDMAYNTETDGDGNSVALPASHKGASILVAYKFTPQWEGILRTDYFDNSKNGGGTPAVVTPDIRNGFGPGAVQDETGAWTPPAPENGSKGAKRTAITMGLNYQYHTNALLKMELRQDRSDLYSFLQTDGSYKKSNNIFGVQTVLSF